MSKSNVHSAWFTCVDQLGVNIIETLAGELNDSTEPAQRVLEHLKTRLDPDNAGSEDVVNMVMSLTNKQGDLAIL